MIFEEIIHTTINAPEDDFGDSAEDANEETEETEDDDLEDEDFGDDDVESDGSEE